MKPFSARDTLLGTLVTDPTPEAGDAYAPLHFDWLFVDGEHGAFTPENVGAYVRRAAHHTMCLVRIAVLTDAWLAAAFDGGAAGVIVPLVNDAELAARAVAAVAGRGAVVVQAETVDAVRNIEAIAATPGVAAVLVGPNDLSASLGIPGAFAREEFQRAVLEIAAGCDRADVPKGIFGASADAVRPWRERGFTLVVAGVDRAIGAGGSAGAAALRRALEK